MAEIQPRKLTEIQKAEIVQALEAVPWLRDLIRAHFLYEDFQEKPPERVVHPKHYNMGGPIGEDGSAQYEVIKLIEDMGWGFEFCMGNALKYTLRAPYKGEEVEDLKKARWYLERAKRHAGRVRARVFRKLETIEATNAWGLVPKPVEVYTNEPQVATTSPDPNVDNLSEFRLALVVDSVMKGDPFEALDHLNVYMVKFGTGKE